MAKQSAKGTGLFSILAVPIMLWTIVPLIWMVGLSLKSKDAFASTDANVFGNFWPKDPTLENYELIFSGGARDLFLPALRNSLIVSLLATLISVILAMFCAYAISRLEFKGKKLILTTALAVSFFPVVAMVTPLFDVWRQIGLFDTIPGLVIPYLALTLPLSIWTMSAFFQQIPWEMEQAAQVDGASSWQAFRKVIVPLAAPGVFTAAILTFFFAWNDFVFGISLTSTENARPIPAALSFFVGADPFNRPASLLAAGAVVSTIPIVIIVLLFQRKIVAGLTSGAVKG